MDGLNKSNLDTEHFMYETNCFCVPDKLGALMTIPDQFVAQMVLIGKIAALVVF